MKIYVGWDSREDIAYQVCEHSIKRRDPSAEVIPLKQNDMRAQGIYTREKDKLATTEFTDPIQTEIETVITNFEPRVNLKNVKVQSIPDDNSIEVEISYDIIGLSGLPQIVNFILDTTRL